MGGLGKQLPIAFGTFLIGGASLAGFPLVTAGFYSKDWILWEVWCADMGTVWLWAAAVIGTVLTSLYIFRVVFIAFFGEPQAFIDKRPSTCIRLPLIILAVLSLIGGWVEVPRTLGHFPLFSEFVQTALPVTIGAHGTVGTEFALQTVATVCSLLGIFLAYLLFRRRSLEAWLHSSVSLALHRVWFAGWGFDQLYSSLCVRPFVRLTHINKADCIDTVYTGVAQLGQIAHRTLCQLQTGHVRWYATGIAAGSVLLVALVVFA